MWHLPEKLEIIRQEKEEIRLMLLENRGKAQEGDCCICMEKSKENAKLILRKVHIHNALICIDCEVKIVYAGQHPQDNSNDGCCPICRQREDWIGNNHAIATATADGEQNEN